MVYIYETDTVWGIGAPINDKGSVDQVAIVKGSSLNKPTSVLCPHIEMLSEYLMLDRLSVEQTWLKDFFALQTSLLVPLEFTRNIPQHIYIDSPLVSFRMLCLPWVKEICEEQSCPITSTSLNRSGQDPILTHEQAKDFHMSWAPDAKLVEGQGNLSGQSSTMLKYNGNGTFEVVRAGAKVDEIKNHLALLSA